jgi:hypothetical protein
LIWKTAKLPNYNLKFGALDKFVAKKVTLTLYFCIIKESSTSCLMRWTRLIVTCDVAQQQVQDPCDVDLAPVN